MSSPELLVTGGNHRRVFILAHGAGAPMDSDFMNDVAEGLAAQRIRVVRFEFPYMADRRRTGSRKPPNPQAQLLACYREVIETVGEPARLVIGGKSMGGRMASLLADELQVRGLLCLGYPFHPPGRPDKLRTEHLQSIETPTLIVQGERDTFGTSAEIPGFGLDDRIRLAWIADGDHSFKPRKKSGHTMDGNLSTCIAACADFIRSL